MATNEERINAAIVQLEGDSEILHGFMHNPNPQTVTTESGVIPTIAKLVVDLSAQVVSVTTEAVTAASSAAASASTAASKATSADSRAAAAEASASNAASSNASAVSQVAAAVAASQASATSSASSLTSSQAAAASASAASTSANSANTKADTALSTASASKSKTDRLLQPSATFPTKREDGADLQLFDKFINTTDGVEYFYTGAGWVSSSASVLSGTVCAYDSIAALKSAKKYSSVYAQCSGYYLAGDGGGGPIRVFVSGKPSGTYVDNGSSIIVPAGGDGSAAWLWCHSGPVVIDWYGATTTSTVDNAPFILKAAQSGATVIIPQGKVYSVSGVEITDKSNFTITGGGQLRLMDLSNKPVLRATRCTNWQFNNVKIDGNKAGQNNTADRNLGSCLFAYMSSDWKIINCEAINGYSGACILAIDNSGDATEVQTNGLIGWNTIKDGGGATAVTLCDGIFANSDNTLIVGNTIHNVSDYGIAADYSRNLKIVDNSIRQVGFVGIGILGAYDWDVSNNRIQQGGIGIAVTLSGNTAISPYISRDVRISGNIISDITNAGGLLGDGIFVDPSALDIEVSLNKIRNVFRGIACSSANCLVIGNTIRDAVDRGLFVDPAGSIVYGNKAIRCGVTSYYGSSISNKTLFEDTSVGAIAATTFLNNWVNVGGSYDVAGFLRQGGIVRLCGQVKSGSSNGSPIFILPVGYRPKTPVRVAVPGDTVGGVANILIDISGNVIHLSGAVAEVHLANISFVTA